MKTSEILFIHRIKVFFQYVTIHKKRQIHTTISVHQVWVILQIWSRIPNNHVQMISNSRTTEAIAELSRRLVQMNPFLTAQLRIKLVPVLHAHLQCFFYSIDSHNFRNPVGRRHIYVGTLEYCIQKDCSCFYKRAQILLGSLNVIKILVFLKTRASLQKQRKQVLQPITTIRLMQITLSIPQRKAIILREKGQTHKQQNKKALHFHTLFFPRQQWLLKISGLMLVRLQFAFFHLFQNTTKIGFYHQKKKKKNKKKQVRSTVSVRTQVLTSRKKACILPRPHH